MDLLLDQLESASGALAKSLAASIAAPHGADALADARSLFSHLHAALIAGQPALFTDHAVWAYSVHTSRNLPANYTTNLLGKVPQIIAAKLSPDHLPRVQPFIDAALAAIEDCFPPPSFLDDARTPLAPLAKDYLQHLLACNRSAAAHLIQSAVARGVDIEDLYLEVFQRTQREIGRLWQTGKISAAQEHYVTAATQFIMSSFYHRVFVLPAGRRCFVGACPPGELHDTGLRIVADFFELAGWQTIFLGADVPAVDLMDVAIHHDAHVIGISATLSTRLSVVTNLIQEFRKRPQGNHIKILVGGPLFNKLDNPALTVGAELYAPDARQAIKLASH